MALSEASLLMAGSSSMTPDVQAKLDAMISQLANEDYANVNMWLNNREIGGALSLAMAARALPLPVTDLTPEDTLIIANPPPFGFSILEEVSGLGALACFYSHETAAADMIRLGPQRFEVRAKKPLPPGRGRVNCTAPAGDKRWRWFGIQFIVPG